MGKVKSEEEGEVGTAKVCEREEREREIINGHGSGVEQGCVIIQTHPTLFKSFYLQRNTWTPIIPLFVAPNQQLRLIKLLMINTVNHLTTNTAF